MSDDIPVIKAQPIQIPCAHCSTLFTPKPRGNLKNEQRFCTKTCMRAAERQRGKNQRANLRRLANAVNASPIRAELLRKLATPPRETS